KSMATRKKPVSAVHEKKLKLDKDPIINISPVLKPTPEELEAQEKADAKEALRQEILDALKGTLHLKLSTGGFTDPNDRTVSLMLGDECLSQVSFSVRQSREYEG